MINTSSFFGAFTTPQKIAVIKALIPGPAYGVEISEKTDLEQPIVSQTLSQLRALDIVSFQQQGSRRYYELNHPEGVRQLIAIAESLTQHTTIKKAA